MKRINWIDWSKAVAVTTVVFCHLPQSQEWFYFRYLQACIITVFFFLSGYLKKDRDTCADRWGKYWHSLVNPYLLLNLLFYPYWLVKYAMLHGALPGLGEALVPVAETLLLKPVDGPLWYLPAILLMHLLVDHTRHLRCFHPLMIGLCVLSFFLYAANKYWLFWPELVPMGFFRRLPYYYIGYVMGRRLLLREVRFRRELVLGASCLALSVVLFHLHLHEGRFLCHIALFYPVNLLFLFGILSVMKLLDAFLPSFVMRLSRGTLLVIGLHVVLITVANYAVAHVLHTDAVCYRWYEALPLSLVIVALLYPLIVWSEQHWPGLLGRVKSDGGTNRPDYRD